MQETWQLLLAIDIGNSSVVMGFFLEEEPLRLELPSDKKLDYLAYETLINKRLEKYELVPHHVAISCVVPDLLEIFEKFVIKKWQIAPYLLKYQKKYGIPIQGSYPGEAVLGSDILANVVYALSSCPKSKSIVIDLGTALTLVGISPLNGLLGGVITLGIKSSLKALSAYTSLLPEVTLDKPRKVLSMNTIECIQSGTVRGYTHLIKGLIEDIKKEMQEEEPTGEIRVMATGGLSFILKEGQGFDLIDKNITLKGIKILWEKEQLN